MLKCYSWLIDSSAEKIDIANDMHELYVMRG